MAELIQGVDRKYRIISRLGGGGFSEVYLVEGPQGRCALKLLKGELGALKPSALEEFKNEFAILKDMRHPNIAAILDFGFDEALQRYYYTSELIEGRDLVNASAGMPLAVLTELIVQALRALAYLLSYRIYHFDIKSANVMVMGTDRPAVKIIDFGLAGIDPHGRLIGTPSYMPPEIVAREHADGRADLYSLGVLWYAALTRRNPFRAQESSETMQRQLHLIPEAPSSIVATLPAWVDAVVMRLLEKNPANRFPTASAVIREINRVSGSAFPLETRETLLSYIPDEGRFVGREEELGRIEAELMRLRGGGAGGGCIVTGPVGSGKTRLLKEVKYRSQLKEVRTVWGYAADANDFGRFCEALSKHLTEGTGLAAFILDDADAALADELRRARLMALLSRISRPAAGAQLFIALAVRGFPDEATRATFEALLPLKLACGVFTRQEMADYLVSLTGLASPPEPLLDGIFERTEGNPLFVTELLKSLIEGGGLFDERGRWNATIFEDVGVDFSKAVIPHTLHDLLLQRTSALSPEARRMLEALACIDRPTGAAELAAIAAVAEPHAALTELLRAGLVDRAENFAIRFHNALLAQAVEEVIPRERAAALHDAVARNLRAAGAPEEEVLLQASLGSDAAAAFEAAFRLGSLALEAGRGELAARHLGRALDLVSRDDVERRAEVQLKLGEAFLISHDYTAAMEHLSAVEATVAAASESGAMARWRAEALTRLGSTYIKLQEFDKARAAFHDARGAIDAAGGDGRLALTIDNALGSIFHFEGRLNEARAIFERTRQQAEGMPDAVRRVANNDLGAVLMAQGRLDEARQVLEEDLGSAVRAGDDLLIGRAHYNLALLHARRSDHAAAIEAYQRCVAVCRRSHNTELLLRAYNGLGNAHQVTGDPDESLAYYERGLALHERTGDLRGGAAIAVNMGIVESARGRIEAALDHLVPAVEYLRSLAAKTAADRVALARGLLEIGDVEYREKRFEPARAHLEEARHIASGTPQAAAQRFWILATLADVARAEQKTGEVSDLLLALAPLATGPAERTTLSELKARCGLPPEAEPAAGAVSAEAPTPHEAAPAAAAPVLAPATAAATAPVAAGADPFRRILEINKLIVGESDLEYVLKTVLYYALEFARAEAGAVLLLQEDGGMKPACQRNMDGREDNIAFSSTLARRAVEGGEPIRTDDALADGRFAAESSVCAHKLRAILCMPIRSRRRVVGAIYLENRFQPGAFASVDLTILDAFADQAGLAIDAACQLLEQEERQAAMAAELAEASQRAERYEEMLRDAPEGLRSDYGEIAARSGAMQRILRTLDKVADTEISVLITGESGTGKELIARALHQHHSKRRAGRFVAINCGAIPATLIESELFGSRTGAFTGARDKRGLIEEAGGGTLFLDEIGELSPELQVKLLRVLQEREVTRLGDTSPARVDVRVIAASNREVEAMLRDKVLREDLYYRLCQLRIEVPPLRARPEDLAMLAERFVRECAPERKLGIHPRLMRRFLAYPWPGNVRELRNLIEVMCALAEGELLDEMALPQHHPIASESGWPPPVAAAQSPRISAAIPTAAPAPPRVRAPGRGEGAVQARIDELNPYEPTIAWAEYERMIVRACFEANGRRARPAAEELGIAATTLYKRLRDAEGVALPLFRYQRGATLESYLPRVFSAALAAAGGKPTVAISNLRVSQGYFYKVLKKAKG